MQTTKISAKAFTLIELMIAMAISLILMLGVATLFQSVGTALNDAQATLLLNNEMSHAQITLMRDLAGVEPLLLSQPSRMIADVGASDADYDDEDEVGGYFTIVEGPGGTPDKNANIFKTDNTNVPYDQTVGDVDDILAFTVTNANTPFRGLVNGQLRESRSAEVIYFVRGNTLYRRVLLVDDGMLNIEGESYPAASEGGGSFYRLNDLSVRKRANGELRPNLLTDLKFRRNRFGHNTRLDKFALSPLNEAEKWPLMPTLGETVSEDWNVGEKGATTVPLPEIDLWNNPGQTAADESQSGPGGQLSRRAGEDIILTNVISFDVKVWGLDPVTGTNRYINLGEFAENSALDPDDGSFGSAGNVLDGGGPVLLSEFDSWSIEYEKHYQDVATQNAIDAGEPPYTSLFDPSRNAERTYVENWECPPPYTEVLTSVEITIRCFEPRSKNIRQIRVTHSFE